MNIEESICEIRSLINSPLPGHRLKWTPAPGPEDHPEARAYVAVSAPWHFLVIGESEKDGRTAVGGTASNLSKGQIFNLPLELAAEMFRQAETP